MARDDVLACIDMVVEAIEREIRKLQQPTRARMELLIDLLLAQVEHLAHKQDVSAHGE